MKTAAHKPELAADARAWAKFMISHALWLAVIPYALLYFQTKLPWPMMPHAIRLAGIPVLLLGATLYLWATNTVWTAGHGGSAHPSRPPADLIVSGPYVLARNPIFAGMLIMIGGFAVIASSWLVAIYLVLYARFLSKRIIIEETGLISRFGDDYLHYLNAVPRWVPNAKRLSEAARRSKLLLPVALAALVAISMNAEAKASPTEVLPTAIALYEAHAFRNVAQQNDLLVIGRGDLPSAQWADSGSVSQPGYLSAQFALYRGTQLIGLRRAVRVGNIMIGVYLPPNAGDATNWENTNVLLCLQGDPSVFIPNITSCLKPLWHDASTVTAAQTLLSQNLVQIEKNLEFATQTTQDPPNIKYGDYVSGNLITQTGQPLAIDAFPSAAQYAAAAFFAGQHGIGDQQQKNIGVPTAQATRVSAAESTRFYHDVTNVADEYAGMSAKTLGSIIIVGLMLLTGGFILSATAAMGEPNLELAIAIPASGYLMFGFATSLLLVAPVLVAMLLLTIAGFTFIFRNLPTQ